MLIVTPEGTVDDFLMKAGSMLRKSESFSVPRIGYITEITSHILSACWAF